MKLPMPAAQAIVPAISGAELRRILRNGNITVKHTWTKNGIAASIGVTVTLTRTATLTIFRAVV
jgi:hypothetical protein